jgi:hypothetical protein
MVVVVAVMASVPLALAAGARRTSSAPDRYLALYPVPFEVTAHQEEGRSRVREIAALPTVGAVEAASFVFGGISPGGLGEALDSIVFAGTAEAVGDRLVAGREPAGPGEFVASKDFAEEHGLSIGTAVRLFTFTPEQTGETGFSGAPQGPTVDSVLVGLIDGPGHLFDPTGIVVFPRALLDDPRIATTGSEYMIDLTDGASIDELRQQLDTIDGGDLVRLEPAAPFAPDIRRAIDAQALGLWILAALAALVTTAVLGQLLVRHSRLSAQETSTLLSLGATRLQIAGETAGRAGVIGALAVALAAGVAIVASGGFPFGFVRPVEPDPGPHADAVVLGVGAVVLALGILGWVFVMTRVRRPASPRRRPVAVDSVAARCPTTAMATGVRFAVTPRDSTSLAARFGGAALMAAALVGTLVYAVSLQRLVVEPERYGANFDYGGDNGADQIPPEHLALLQADPAVTDVSVYTYSPTRVEGADETLFVVGMERLRGLLDPPLLSGRLPIGPGEIAIGRVSARQLDASIGDVLTLAGPSGGAEYEITGLIVPPGLGGNDLLGVGSVVTSAGYRRIDPDRVPHAFAVRFKADTPRDTVERLLGAFGSSLDEGGPARPPAIANTARVTYVPVVLALLLAVLAVVLAVSGAYTAVRQRNHEVAVLRTLGAERGWLVRAVNWLAVTATLIPAVVGIPLGLIAGRLAFRAYANSLGAVNSAAAPVVVIAVGLGVLVLVAAVAATVAGRSARRLAPARLLHAE